MLCSCPVTPHGKSGLAPRHAESGVLKSLREAPVVLVNGPRQCGKTTLVRDQLGPKIGGTFVTLDEEPQLQACLADPITFLDRPLPLVVDEFQRAGDALLRAAKTLVDRDRRPGRFLLTGSTRFLTLPRVSESLAGRIHVVDLWPFSQGEIDRMGPRSDSVLPALLQTGSILSKREDPRSAPTRREIFDRVCRGGYPEVRNLAPPARRRFFSNYIRTVVHRDVPELSRVRHVDELPRILRLLAAVTAQEINDSKMAARLSIDRRTLRSNYLPLLRAVGLVIEIPAWSRKLASRVSTRPKSHLVDAGLAAHLIGADTDSLVEPTSTASGALLETFAANEILRQASRFGDDFGVALYHYRSHTGAEVDLIIESDDGRTVGIEVKAGATVRKDDFRHLAALRDRLDRVRDARFIRGVVLYCGADALGFGDRLEALPIDRLWSPP
jgi:predicted AAA+ superfamily ATPase